MRKANTRQIQNIKKKIVPILKNIMLKGREYLAAMQGASRRGTAILILSFSPQRHGLWLCRNPDGNGKEAGQESGYGNL